VEYVYPFDLEEKLCHTVLRGAALQISETLADVATDLSSKQIAELHEIKCVYLHLIHAVIRMTYKAGHPLSNILGDDFEPYLRIEQRNLQQEIFRYVEDVCLRINGFINDQHAYRNERMVQNALCYIDQHYNKDVGLDQLAEAMRCSSTFINRLLKQHTGYTFYHLLTQKRIESSKQLLAIQHCTVCHISEAVGYNNVHSFIRAFKRSEGATPSQFRASLENKSIYTSLRSMSIASL
jgi:YesN/AraC family two-component response regulator